MERAKDARFPSGWIYHSLSGLRWVALFSLHGGGVRYLAEPYSEIPVSHSEHEVVGCVLAWLDPHVYEE